jgi:hypothetical protein
VSLTRIHPPLSIIFLQELTWRLIFPGLLFPPERLAEISYGFAQAEEKGNNLINESLLTASLRQT